MGGHILLGTRGHLSATRPETGGDLRPKPTPADGREDGTDLHHSGRPTVSPQEGRGRGTQREYRTRRNVII